MPSFGGFFRRLLGHFIPSEDNAYRPHLLRRPWLAVFLALILATEGFLVANLIARQSNVNFLAAVVPAEIIVLTNDERAQNNVGTLTENATLDAAAQAKANDMAAKGYFSHVSPDGKTPWQWITDAGYQYQYAGENLAVRFIDSQDVINAWMASPTHRANIVKPVYTDIGVGVAEGTYEGEPATFVVQDFAAPATYAATAPPPTLVSPPVPPPAPVASIASTAPSVEGASTQAATPPAPDNSFTNSLMRQVVRAFSEPQSTANLILGGIAALLIIALFFAFFMHVHLQSTGMLFGGVTVALFALSLLALNLHVSEQGAGQQQAAGVALESSTAPLIGEGASTGYALFPQ